METKIAVFDLDLTLSTRHMWNQLGYHHRSAEELRAMPHSEWLQEQGGPEEFQPGKLVELFSSLKRDGYVLGLATYNRRRVAESFLDVFELRQFFRDNYIMSREDGGPKSKHWRNILDASPAEHMEEIRGVYYDDSLDECLKLKRLFPHFAIHHVEQPLASPFARSTEIHR